MDNWWICYLPLIVLFWLLFQNRKEMNQYLEVRIKRKKGDKEMQELAKRFIGKDVYINTVASGAVDGILKEVVDNAAVLEKDGKESVVNLDYVIRIREYPTNKNGKRKLMVADLELS